MLLSCPVCCNPHFEGIDSLRKSLIHVAYAPLVCPVCQETFNGLDKFTIHLFCHANNSGATNSDANLVPIDVTLPHIDSMKNEIDKRIENLNISDSRTELASNPFCLKEETQSRENYVIMCDICSFTFTDKSILDMHQKLLHQTTPDEKTGKYSYHCHLCSKRFEMRGSLMVHLRVAHYGFNNHRSHQPHTDIINFEQEGDEPLQLEHTTTYPAKAQDYKQWNCDVCEKMFTTKYFLKKHKRLHTGEMPYSCTICNKLFTFQQSYHKHMLYHSSDKPYVCSECGRAFKEHSTLQNHERIHSGERPFGCEICGKKFRQRVSYLVHLRIHTGVMPYKCTGCGKSFRYKVSQRSHKCSMNPPGSVIRVVESDTSISQVLAKSYEHENESTLVNNNDIMKKSSITSLDTLEPHYNGSCGEETKRIMAVDYDTGNINLIMEDKVRTNNYNLNVTHDDTLTNPITHQDLDDIATD